MEFKEFADKVNSKFLELSKTGKLFRVNVSKDLLWDTYQESYTEEYNPIFRERREHDCNTCNSFIRRLGSVVTIIDGKMDSIWNVKNLQEPYKTVSEEMHKLVTSHDISSIFLTDEKTAGKEYNIEENVAGNIKWDHFYADIDNCFISQNVASDRGDIDTTVSVFNRALSEFSMDTLQTVEDLCDDIYKGAEFRPIVSKFIEAKRKYEESNKKYFPWLNYENYPASIRNSAIGTLIIDIQKGTDLEVAVKKYESVVAPSNYKRTSAVVTEGMKKQAIDKINELGIEESLERRHAKIEDISINNVLFANKESQKLMKGSVANLLSKENIDKIPNKPIEIDIDNFINDILPGSTNIEALVENRHTSNFVSLVAPVNESPNILKWNNNFTWSYNGEVTDAMKERVKSAGGNVDGILRCSIQWNEDNMDSNNDLDVHCQEPLGGCHIYYGSKHCPRSTGDLDVDIQRPGRDIAVENITYQDINKMKEGSYKFYVNNYSGRNVKGFRAQIEFDGTIYEFNCNRSVTSDVHIANVVLKDGKFNLVPKLESSQSQKTEWDVKTLQYKKVQTIMLSPNYWDDQNIGNKHYFFMLEDCKNPSDVRGFYNEFLSNELTPHRKVFEMLSGLMKCKFEEEQLSGLGFSSTLRNSIHLKVDNKPYLVKF